MPNMMNSCRIVEAFEDPHIAGFLSSRQLRGYSLEKRTSIPEVIYNDPSVVLRQGYSESKHTAERIYAAASAQCGVPSSIHRVGQIGDPTTEKGVWNKQEWLPSLVATSKTIKQIPNSLGSVSVHTQGDDPCAAFHVVSPTAAGWQTLIPAMTKHFEIEQVDLSTWIVALESFTNPMEDDLKDKPALKILDFFQSHCVLGGWSMDGDD
ncbi:Male sterility NAD-binding [Penicillium hispanicum]|uniref:Male sterility NAD-binding n=1 Tax=Penicillium hispanicum TaxID=1080232 RepID=UPI0025412B48|nr:Male sterility NAD-binding [Penicillium hispanicum]KAJ5587251.1 Male sterility NAD-binding [Penicillium hispanicum]